MNWNIKVMIQFNTCKYRKVPKVTMRSPESNDKIKCLLINPESNHSNDSESNDLPPKVAFQTM